MVIRKFKEDTGKVDGCKTGIRPDAIIELNWTSSRVRHDTLSSLENVQDDIVVPVVGVVGQGHGKEKE